MTEQKLRGLIVDLGASLFSRGFSVGGAGNISVRLPDGKILSTPTNSSLGRLAAAELSVVDAEGNHVSGHKPTKEMPLHMAAYRARADCGSVVHLHSTYITALSCLEDLDTENALRPFTPYYVMRIGRLPVLPYFKPGSLALADAVTAALQRGTAFLLANHGAVVCGPSLTEAVNSAEELEETAKLHFLLHSSGRPVRYLSEAEIADVS